MANVFNEETHHMRSVPAHKQLDPAKQPGQWINHDMMDDMAGITPVNVRAEDGPAFRKLVTAAAYKPVHGGYPGATPEERAALKLVK